jgi:hypothetical protein
VTVDEHEPVAQQGGRIAVGIEVGLVRDVVPAALEEAHGLELPDERALPALELPGVRPVE